MGSPSPPSKVRILLMNPRPSACTSLIRSVDTVQSIAAGASTSEIGRLASKGWGGGGGILHPHNSVSPRSKAYGVEHRLILHQTALLTLKSAASSASPTRRVDMSGVGRGGDKTASPGDDEDAHRRIPLAKSQKQQRVDRVQDITAGAYEMRRSLHFLSEIYPLHDTTRLRSAALRRPSNAAEMRRIAQGDGEASAHELRPRSSGPFVLARAGKTALTPTSPSFTTRCASRCSFVLSVVPVADASIGMHCVQARCSRRFGKP